MVFFPKYGQLVRRAIIAGGGGQTPQAESQTRESLARELDYRPEIPLDWYKFGWPKLRSLAASLPGDDDRPITSRQDAVARIVAEVNRRERLRAE